MNFTSNNQANNSTSEPKQTLMPFREGAISTMTVAFILIHELKHVGGLESVELLAKLHSVIKSIINTQQYKGVQVLSSLLGVIILLPDSLQLDTINLIININKEMKSIGIPIRVGMSRGDIQELIDVDGKSNFIGVAINHSARLATANLAKHPGLLVHDSLASHLQAGLRASHWLSARNTNRLSIEVAGKRNEKFICYYPSESIWPTLSDITYQYDEQFQSTSKNAAIISYDLPNFSDGDLNQLSQRFRAITDVFLALVAETKLPLKYFYFSPGGDGGIMVFTDLEKKPVYDLAKNFAEKLVIESANKNSLISVQCRIGLHYGTILLYENAEGNLRPTGEDIFIADSITFDEEAKKAGKLIFTEPFKSIVSGGDNQYFQNNFSSLSVLSIYNRVINRYSNISNTSTNTTTFDLLAKLVKGEATYDALRSSSKIANNHVVNSPTVNQTTTNNYFDYFIKEIRTKYKELSLLNIPTDIQPLIKKFDFFGIEWSTSFGFTIAVVKADNLTKEQIKLLFETFTTINDFLYKNPKVLDISYLVWLVAFTLSGTLCFIFENQLSQEIREFIQNQQKAGAAYDKGLSSFFWVQSTSTSLGWVVSLKNGQIDSSLGKTPDGSNYHAINTIKHLEKLERTIKEICQTSTNSNATPPSSPNPNQKSNSSTTTNSNQTNSNLSHILEVHKQEIIEDIASAYKQLGMTLSEVDKVRIQRQINALEQELKDVEDKLNKAKN